MADIRYETHGRVRLITIDRAERMNSLDFAANDELIEIWRAFDRDDDAYVFAQTGPGSIAVARRNREHSAENEGKRELDRPLNSEFHRPALYFANLGFAAQGG